MQRIRQSIIFRRSKSGSVALMILMLITVVSFVLIRFIERAGVEVQGEGYYVEKARLRLQAWSMMEIAVATLADVKAIDGALHSPVQGWGDPLAYAQIQPEENLSVSFEFIDESAKMGINSLGFESLFLLFDELGLGFDVSQNLAGKLIDWIDADDAQSIDGAESKEYSSSELAARPANQALQSLDELKYVLGFKEVFFDEEGNPNALFDSLSTIVTHHNVQRININTAAPATLFALVGLDELQSEMMVNYIAGLDGLVGTEDDNYFTSVSEASEALFEIDSSLPLSSEIELLTIKVTVQEGGSAYTLQGTINTQSGVSIDESEEQGSVNYPFLFLEIREQPGTYSKTDLGAAEVSFAYEQGVIGKRIQKVLSECQPVASVVSKQNAAQEQKVPSPEGCERNRLGLRLLGRGWASSPPVAQAALSKPISLATASKIGFGIGSSMSSGVLSENT